MKTKWLLQKGALMQQRKFNCSAVDNNYFWGSDIRETVRDSISTYILLENYGFVL